MDFSQDSRKELAGREIGKVTFETILGFVTLSEEDDKCPFCENQTLRHHSEIGVGGHVENLQSSCESADCAFFQSPYDGRLRLPDQWVKAHLER